MAMCLSSGVVLVKATVSPYKCLLLKWIIFSVLIHN
jgi:hypothetical protein